MSDPAFSPQPADTRGMINRAAPSIPTDFRAVGRERSVNNLETHLRHGLADMLAKLQSLRKTGTGWMARCPAHADRSPSLSVTQTADGTVLVRCHAGCTAADIVAAIGLTMADLFPNKAQTPTRPHQRPTPERIRAELRREFEALQLDGQRPLAREINEVRHRVAVRLGISLEKIPERLCDTYGNHARDPLWPALFAWALHIAHIQVTGKPQTDFGSRLQPSILIVAEQIAADAMRSIERDGRSDTTRREGAA
jgi:CHC2 zinc finger